jgi:hypothetical protein
MFSNCTAFCRAIFVYYAHFCYACMAVLFHAFQISQFQRFSVRGDSTDMHQWLRRLVEQMESYVEHTYILEAILWREKKLSDRLVLLIHDMSGIRACVCARARVCVSLCPIVLLY